MRFKVEYSFSNDGKSEMEPVSEVDEMSLRYNLFLGSVRLTCRGVRLDLDWGWIPLLDFAISLSDILNSLDKKLNGTEEFDFTESDEIITVTRDEDAVTIRLSSMEETLILPFDEFRDGVEKFYRNVFEDVMVRNPELVKNAALRKYAIKN